MKVPLSVTSTVSRGKEKLNIWYQGKQRIIDAPIRPYFYTKQKLDIPGTHVEEVRAKALSNYQEKTFYKYSFPMRADLVKARSDLTFEDNIPFILRHRIDMPDLFAKFPHTNELKFLFLDIEQHTEEGNMFPTYEDRITAIAFCGNDRKIKCGYLKKDTVSDKKLLLKFLDWYQKYNPDILVVYNKSYDIPTLFERCKRNKINTTRFSKNEVKPLVDRNRIFIDGVVIYDVYLSARADQSLSGNVVNRGLKEVSNWFGFEEERAPLTPKQIKAFQGTKELVEYNKDDVIRLLKCFDVYWPNIEFNANDLKVPLSEAVDMNITDLGLIVVGDEYREHNIIADGTNKTRYPQIFKKKHRAEEKGDVQGSNYQGALVYLEQSGLFEPVYKADYSSMYPAIMSTFNFSPDTTTLLMYEPRTKFKIEEENKWFIYHIPDEVLDKNMVIQVSKKQGFAAKLVEKFLKERSQYKAEWKKTGNPRFRALSDNRKVKANGGVYGIQGSANHAFGFAPIAIATTGVGRECIKLLVDLLDELYPKSVIEVDTDGVYFHTEKNKFNQKEIIDKFNERLEQKFGRKVGLSIDVDEYDKGYFYKTKNYVLQVGEKIIYHGAAMKASSKDRLSKELIKELSVAKLGKKPTKDIIAKYLTLDFPLEWFVKNIRLGRSMRQYKNENALAPRLAREAEEYLGMKPQVNNQYFYVKTLQGYRLHELVDKKDIDIDYYKGQIKTIMDMFDIQSVPSLAKWGI